jgi:23S rRNA U2552 (ribose-2'-O)-methylase RlmE/FtsJ
MEYNKIIETLCSKYHAGQDHKEISWFCEACRKINPRVVVEIGVYSGGNLKILSSLVEENNGIAIGIDYDWSHFGLELTEPSKASVHLLDGDSHEQKTYQKLEEMLGEKKIDVLFIDGDHSEAGCRMDYEIFSTLVRDGGVIGFHDLNDGGSKGQNAAGEFNVKGFWKKFQHPRKFEYFSDLHDNTGYGIGYIIK